MVQYIHAPGVIGQRDIRLHGYTCVREALSGTEGTVGAEESVLALSFDGRLFELNVAGAILWEELRRPCSPEDIAGVLEELFGLDPSQAAADARSFLDEMADRGLIGVDCSPPGTSPAR